MSGAKGALRAVIFEAATRCPLECPSDATLPAVLQDTTPAAMARYHELLRAQKPYERLAQAMALTRMVRQLAEAGIRQRHPNATEHDVRVRLTVRLYGRDVALRLFSDVPTDAI
jgi:hypothetical protein